MKNEIVRSPETDRKLLRIPTTAEDLEGAVLVQCVCSAGYAVPFGVATKARFQTINADTHDAVSNETTGLVFTCPSNFPGMYRVLAIVALDWASGDQLFPWNLAIAVNDVAVREIERQPDINVQVDAQQIDALIDLNGGDRVTILITQTTGGSRNVETQPTRLWLDIHRLWDTAVVVQGGGINTSGGGSSDPGSRVRG